MINKQNNQKACPPVFRKSELRRGFTLLETLVAISIITLTIVGPLAMAAQASKLISVAKNQLTANYLAQEAIELIRYEKDTNMILENVNDVSTRGYDWLLGEYDIDGDGNPVVATMINSLFGCIGSSREDMCYIDSNPLPTFYPCQNEPNNGCDTAGGPYDTTKVGLILTDAEGYRPAISVSGSGGTQTSFMRFVQIERFKTGAGDTDLKGSGAKVKVKIMWKDTYGDKTLYVQENMYKYR